MLKSEMERCARWHWGDKTRNEGGGSNWKLGETRNFTDRNIFLKTFFWLFLELPIYGGFECIHFWITEKWMMFNHNFFVQEVRMKREQCPLVIGLSLQSDTRRQLIRRDHSNNWENRIPPENLSSADKRIRKSRLKEEILVLFRIQIFVFVFVCVSAFKSVSPSVWERSGFTLANFPTWEQLSSRINKKRWGGETKGMIMMINY